VLELVSVSDISSPLIVPLKVAGIGSGALGKPV
jgi:hypothetical protein